MGVCKCVRVCASVCECVGVCASVFVLGLIRRPRLVKTLTAPKIFNRVKEKKNFCGLERLMQTKNLTVCIRRRKIRRA